MTKEKVSDKIESMKQQSGVNRTVSIQKNMPVLRKPQIRLPVTGLRYIRVLSAPMINFEK